MCSWQNFFLLALLKEGRKEWDLLLQEAAEGRKEWDVLQKEAAKGRKEWDLLLLVEGVYKRDPRIRQDPRTKDFLYKQDPRIENSPHERYIKII